MISRGLKARRSSSDESKYNAYELTRIFRMSNSSVNGVDERSVISGVRLRVRSDERSGRRHQVQDRLEDHPAVFIAEDRLNAPLRVRHHTHHVAAFIDRSEEHTSELQSRGHLVCILLLVKK